MQTARDTRPLKDKGEQINIFSKHFDLGIDLETFNQEPIGEVKIISPAGQ
jgi:hypothetical protein